MLASEAEGVDLCEEYIAIGTRLKQQNKVENVKFQVAKVEEFVPDADGVIGGIEAVLSIRDV